MKAQMKWLQGMKFSCDNQGLESFIDATAEHGGTGSAANPKELILNAMMGCTAMDVVSMLTKMRQTIKNFNMCIDVEKTTQHPTHFKTAALVYELAGDIDPEKAKKAVEASMTKYCGVNYMISKSCKISYRLFVNEDLVVEDEVKFIEPSAEF